MVSKKPVNPKEEAAVRARRDKVKKDASQITIETATRRVAETTSSITKNLAQVTTEVAGALAELATVQQAVELAKEELQNIRDITVLERSKDELEAEYSRKKLDLERDREDQMVEHSRRIQNLNIEREREQDKQTYDWQLETQRRRQLFDEELRTERARERERKEALEKEWTAKSEALAKSEQELLSLRKQVEEFPARMDAEVKKQVAIVSNSMKKDYEHNLAILQKDAETNARISASTIQQLTTNNELISKQLTEALTRVASAEENVRKIAEKALESASGQRALAEMQSFRQGDSSRPGKS